MNPFSIDLVRGSMKTTKATNGKRPEDFARPGKGRAVRVVVEGKVMYVTPRGARILRAARKAFKGVEL